MSAQNLEMQISQYADGSLAKPARANLETCINGDPHLRELLNEYRQLDSSIATLPSLPMIEWDMLADRISSAVASATMFGSDEAELETSGVAGRIDGSLGRTAWLRTSLAAGVLLTLCSGALLWHQQGSDALNAPTAIHQVVATNDVTGPKVDPSAGPVMVQVKVGAGTPTAAPAVQTAMAPTPKKFLAVDMKPGNDKSPKIH